MLRYLLDTNVLVYGFDSAEPDKQRRALETVERVGLARSGALPAQALAEFCRVAMGKLDPPLSPAETYRQIELYERAFPVVPLTPAVVLEAVRGVRDHAFSYTAPIYDGDAQRASWPTSRGTTGPRRRADAPILG